ncbi:general odorant-binding protein 69-like [Anopheles maculipalpis]|uniref:general odorant-binding protein 69-like n=1 Tax=Anopheles maculipalpis TaxID=1496333 RepID=UPI002159A831|nr:general odorant-binding protein 69-like [Anopheles maculipalpis]
MHRLLLETLCAACCLLTVGALKHHILTKSWDEAQTDCLEYLRTEPSRSLLYSSHQYGDDQTTKELIFCILLNLRIFEVTQNVPRVELMRQFFTPDDGDTMHVNRTNECLRRVQIPLKENSSSGSGNLYCGAIETANGIFRCFYYYYGNLNRNAVELPPTVLERQQIQQECAKIVGIPEGLLRCGSQLKDHPLYSNFSHCVILRSGSMDLDVNSGNSLKADSWTI